MNIASYWKLPTKDQVEIKQQVKQADLEAYAEEHELLVYEGKLIKPEDYPCTCEKQSPYHCFEENKEFPDNEWSKQSVEIFLKAQEDEMCPCPCHTYWEPI